MNSIEVIKLLQESPLFRKVKSSLLASMLLQTTRVKLVAEQILMVPEQQNDHIYIVLSGRLRAQTDMFDTRPLVLFGMGECMGEMSLFDEDNVSFYGIAVTDCELLSIPHADVWAVLNQSLQASHNLLAILASRVSASSRMSMSNRMWPSNRILTESMEYRHGYEALDYINTVTGVYNGRWLSKSIPRLTHRFTMNRQSCVFILMKIDNFGQFDARFGSLGSDQAQRTIAHFMLGCLRPNDLVAHISEDQFAIFLPQTELDKADKVTSRLLEGIDQAIIVTPSGDALPPVAVSLGVSQLQSDDTLDSLIARASSAMRCAQNHVTLK
jgi:diguanylate cyclase (GGDEF)-like protein